MLVLLYPGKQVWGTYGTKIGHKDQRSGIAGKGFNEKSREGRARIIVLSSATDPYLQVEKDLKLTRKLLEIILKYHFPVHIITKSDLVTRDFDLLQEIDQTAIVPSDLPGLNRGTIITFSFSTIEESVAKIFEPGAPSPKLRLETLKKTNEAGFLTGVSMMPLLPWISDTTAQLEAMFGAFQEHGAQYAFPAHLNIYGNDPSSSRALVMRSIENHYPDLLPKYQKYFERSDDMPDYYKQAFYKKMSELGQKYKVRNRIIPLQD